MAKTKKTPKTEYALKRPPVVTMLGHVDHGKTSLLDAIRDTRVQSGEAGGITQSVRAHLVHYKTKAGEDHKITFIDTPGHEAFSNMRERGAQVTDIVVLVVSAKDGVKPQTKEAIKFAKDSKVPIIVALNKIDIKGAEKAKIKRDLSTAGVQIEELGGDSILVETSATKKTGIEDLLEAILLVAQMSDLKVKRLKDEKAQAVVLESTTDKSMGPMSLCITKAGTVNIGDFMAWDENCGNVRAILDDNFVSKKETSISEPSWIIGFLSELPVGTKVSFYDSKKEFEVKTMEEESKVEESLDEDEGEKLDPEILTQLLQAKKEEDKTSLNIILKSESQGTLEVVRAELERLSNEETKVNILESGTGEITRDDIITASTSAGIVLGFKSKLSKSNEKIAKQEKVLVRNYEIIYDLITEIDEVITSMTKPVMKETIVAKAEVKKVFELTNGLKVAGLKVTEGTILKGYQCHVNRKAGKKEETIGSGKITSLRYLKEEVKEASKGSECGIMIDPPIDIEKGDTVICFKIEKVK